MRLKRDYRSASVEAYNTFCTAYPDIQLSYTQWSKIVYTFNQTIRDYILESGDQVKLPFGLGFVAIGKKKMKKFKTDPEGRTWVNLPIDWKKSKELGKHVYNFNNHTDGYRYKWIWFGGTARFYMADIWNMKPFRSSSRKLAELLNKANSPYPERYKQWFQYK